MPLQDLMYLQVAEMCEFFEPSPLRLWVVRHPKDLQHVLVRILAGIQDDADNTNVFFYFDTPFRHPEQYYAQVREAQESELDQLANVFAGAGAALPPRVEDRGPAVECLARRVDALAAALPESAGSLVLVLDPSQVGDAGQLAASLATLVDHSKEARSKFLFLDAGKHPAMDWLCNDVEGCGGQDFQLSPEVIEEQVRLDLDSGDLNPVEQRQYLAMAGAFAFAWGRLDEAAATQARVAELAEQEGEPSEIATVLYNLGNTHLRAKKPDEAEKCFARSATVCLDTGNDTLLAMVMLNLGVSLHRQGKVEAAVQSFDVGRQTFKSLNHLAGEVHALDTKAAALAEAGQNPGAEEAWREALGLVEEIRNEDFAELRQSCHDDLVGKLHRFYEATGQGDKRRSLPPAPEHACHE